MVSAFHPPLFHTSLDDQESPTIPFPKKSTIRPVRSQLAFDADETEDEEVKMNCIGGIPPDSDYCSTSDDDDNNEDDSDDDSSMKLNKTEPDRFDMKVVNFVTRQVQQSVEILSPRVVRGLMIESIAEGEPDDDDDDQSTSSLEFSSSGGARGLPLAPESASDCSQSDLDDECSESTEEGEPCYSYHGSTMDNQDLDNSDAESGSSQGDLLSDELHEPPELLDLENALAKYSHSTTSWDHDDGGVEDDDDDDDDDTLSVQGINATDALVGTSFHSLVLGDEEVLANEAEVMQSTKSKRCLSTHTMLENERESRITSFESPKRMRFVSLQEVNWTSGLFMPDLTLGPSAFPPTSEGTVSPSTDDEIEYDRRMSEELEESDLFQDRESTPVPLLTPPASPLTIETKEGTTTMCEWPCNLVVDNAMTSALRLKAPSPNSLRLLEEDEEDRIENYLRGHPLSPLQSTSLTPLIRGIAFRME